ncbi:MAG: hypothetical protein ACR2KA_09290 [Opitutales bacterium]
MKKAMAPIDEWLNAWLSAVDLARTGECRSLGPLHVYAMTTGGDGPQFSGPLPAWEGFASQLSGNKVSLGLVAVEADSAEQAYFKYPGVTLVFAGPGGGTQVARSVMTRLGRLGIGGVLAETDLSGRFGVLRILMTPRWYAQSGDKLFGLDWSKVPNDPVHCADAKKAWALGIQDALRKALTDIPSALIDTIRFGAFDIVDWLHDLGPREHSFLYGAKPRQLADALNKLGSFDLDVLSSEKARPFDEGGPLLTIYDALEQEVSLAWLRENVSTPMCHVLHVRGRSDDYRAEILFCLLRRMPDGRLRLATVTMSPSAVPLLEDCFEVNPEVLFWSEGFISPTFGVGKVMDAFAERYGDLHEPGTWHQPSFSVELDEVRPALVKWFCKSPSAGVTHDLLADLQTRVYPHLRTASGGDLEERQLSADESGQLAQWLFEQGQQEVELRWLLHQWSREWRAPAPEAHEVEQLLRGI